MIGQYSPSVNLMYGNKRVPPPRWMDLGCPLFVTTFFKLSLYIISHPMRRFLLVLSFGICLSYSYAQDTLTVMTYNLLNFPAQGSTRYNDLREIIEYTNPDIFICSEITDNSAINLLLNNVFNVPPVNYYAASAFVDGPDTDNLLFYNTNKLTLVSQNQVPTALRDITRYRLYSCESMDTVWYDVFSLHLKASSGWSNAQDRLAECQVLTNYINGLAS